MKPTVLDEKPEVREAPAPEIIIADERLMQQAKQGDRNAYAMLFNRYADRLGRVAYLMLHSSSLADDVVQETFTRGLSSLSGYRGDGNPQAWFLSIAVNLCRHHLRDSKTGPDFAEPEKLDLGKRIRRARTRGAVTNTLRNESARQLTIAMGYLTEGQKEAFILHYREELPYETIGQMLGIRSGAARALAHRAKAVLREKLGTYFFNDTQRSLPAI